MDRNFDKRSEEFTIEVDRYIESIIDDYLAFYIQALYKEDLIEGETTAKVLNSAIEDLNSIRIEMCDIEKVKTILKEFYKLNIENDDPLIINEIH